MRTRTARAFTLIELLVVVAIIGLLIAILLPSLTRAKEAARVSVCLSNMRSIGQAAAAYLSNKNNTFMFTVPLNYWIGSQQIAPGLFTEFYWGGGVPDAPANEWDEGIGGPWNPAESNTDVYIVAPRHRPLNKYLSSEVTWDNSARMSDPGRTQIPANLPGFFKCPSDRTVAVPGVGLADDIAESDAAQECWKWWGTSYPINWYWCYYYIGDDDQGCNTVNAGGAYPGNHHPYNTGANPFLRCLAGNMAKNIPGLGSYMLREHLAGKGNASTFLIFYENQMNYALESAKPRGASNSCPKQLVGWHRELNKHVGSFLDGSARYGTFDTRFVDGQAWTTWPPRDWTDGWAPYNDD